MRNTEPPPKSHTGVQEVRLLSIEDWLTARRFALLLGVLIFVAFPQVLLGWETFVARDFGLFSYPLAHFQRECFWRGELPFWNPYSNCGVPFLAQWNTMPLYPPAFIYLLLPLSWSLGVFCLVHLWFAGLGMYWLSRKWTGNSFAAGAAGVVFAFNGLSLNLLMWPSHIATLSWMPWVILAGERAWREGGRRLIVAALVGALQMLAGGPETILLTWLLCLSLLTLKIFQDYRSRVSAAAQGLPDLPQPEISLRFAVLVLAVAALSAVQLLPFLDLAAHSQRHTGFADTRWSLPVRGWANFLVPMVFGSTWKQDVFFQYGQYWTSSYYVGLVTLALALLAIWGVREPKVWWLAGACLAAYILALGGQTFVYSWLRRVVPQLSLMTYPVKFVTVIVFAAPLLAAFGLAAWQRRRFMARLIVLAGLLLALVVAVLLWARGSLPVGDDFNVPLSNGLVRAAFLLLSVGLLCLIGKALPGQWPRLVAILFLLSLWADVWTHEPSQNPTVSTAVYAPGVVRTELALDPQPRLGGTRMMISPAADAAFNYYRTTNHAASYVAKRLACFSNCNLLDDLPKVNGFFSLVPHYSDIFNSLLYASTNASFPRLEDFLSVSHITSPKEFIKWERRDSFLPEITAGQKPVFLDDTGALRRIAAPDFEPAKVVFLPVERATELAFVKEQPSARVFPGKLDLAHVEMEVEAAEPSVVVVAQTYYHCWRATVDDQPAPVLRANLNFQAVVVPAGKHQVRLAYQDRAFQIGAVISMVALVGCGVGWVRGRGAPR